MEKKWSKRIGYGSGDFACNLVFATMASFLMYFYTDIFGLSTTIVGALLLYTRVLDAFADGAMGIIIDRTRSRWGQSRPYIAFGAPFFALFAILTFYVPQLGDTGKIIYAFVTYMLLNVAYSVVNIPLNVIVPRMTSDIDERNKLMATRIVFALLGTAMVMSVTPELVKFFGQGDDKWGYFVTMSFYGVLSMFIFFFTFSQTKEVIPPAVKLEDKSDIVADFKGTTSQVWIMAGLAFLYFGLFVIRNTASIYYFTYNLGRADWITFIGLFGILSGLPVLFFLPKLQQIFPIRGLLISFCVIYILGSLLCYFAGNNITLILISLTITGVGIYGIFALVMALQPNVIDYSEFLKNRSIGGLIASIQGFCVKCGMGVAALVMGLIMDAGGYVANAEQSKEALFSLEVCFIWLPIGVCVLIALFASGYILDAKRAHMSEVLDLRRKQLAFAAPQEPEVEVVGATVDTKETTVKESLA